LGTYCVPGAVPSPALYRPIHPYHIHLTYAFSFLFHRWETEVGRDEVACARPESCYGIGRVGRQVCGTTGPMFLGLDSHRLKHFALVLSRARARGAWKRPAAYRQISLLVKSDREATSSRKPSLSSPALESAPCSDFSDEAPLTFYRLSWLPVELSSLLLQSRF